MAAHPVSRRWILLVFILSLGYAWGIQQVMRPLSPDGVHFHPWSSEDMMQTVSLRELRRSPLATLMNIHIQPPGFDAIRAALAQPWARLSDSETLRRVDLALDLLGAILLALMATLAYAWLTAQAGAAAGLLGTLVLVLHPASIMFATFLDSTLLSALLILCNCYLLWRLRAGLPTPLPLFSLVVLALFFVRSIFQWPALVLFVICLAMVRASRRQLLVYILVTGLISTFYLVKQYSQFGIFSTSSFAGVNLANSIDVGMGTAKYAAYLNEPGLPTRVLPGMPPVLTAPTKLTGQPNFNHIDYLALNDQLAQRYLRALRGESPGSLLRNYTENASIYFRPSSTYSSGHIIVEHLPWRRMFDLVFSAPVLPVLLVLALIAWCTRARRARTFSADVGVMLPAIFVMLISILGDKGENMRFKFFVEPVMVIFLVLEVFALPAVVRRAPPADPSLDLRSSET